MDCAVRFPPPPLDAIVERIWHWEAPPRSHRYDRMLPSAQAQLVINLLEDETRVYDDALRCRRFSAAALDAPSHRSFVIDTTEQIRVVGVVFHAGGAAQKREELFNSPKGGSSKDVAFTRPGSGFPPTRE